MHLRHLRDDDGKPRVRQSPICHVIETMLHCFRFAQSMSILLAQHPIPALANASPGALRFGIAHFGTRLPRGAAFGNKCIGFGRKHFGFLKASAKVEPVIFDASGHFSWEGRCF